MKTFFLSLILVSHLAQAAHTMEGFDEPYLNGKKLSEIQKFLDSIREKNPALESASVSKQYQKLLTINLELSPKLPDEKRKNATVQIFNALSFFKNDENCHLQLSNFHISSIKGSAFSSHYIKKISLCGIIGDPDNSEPFALDLKKNFPKLTFLDLKTTQDFTIQYHPTLCSINCCKTIVHPQKWAVFLYVKETFKLIPYIHKK
jgi:hypothetical protein